MAVFVRNVVVSDPKGLHMRPSTAIVQAAREAEGSTITLRYMGRSASATSVLSLMMLGATQGAEVEVSAETQASCPAAVDRICQILRSTQPGSHE